MEPLSPCATTIEPAPHRRACHAPRPTAEPAMPHRRARHVRRPHPTTKSSPTHSSKSKPAHNNTDPVQPKNKYIKLQRTKQRVLGKTSLGRRTSRRSDATEYLERRLLRQLKKSSGLNDCRENKINRNVTIINSRKQNGVWERKNNHGIYITWLSCEQCLHRQ